VKATEKLFTYSSHSIYWLLVLFNLENRQRQFAEGINFFYLSETDGEIGVGGAITVGRI
jgi:hypothetical protein